MSPKHYSSVCWGLIRFQLAKSACQRSIETSGWGGLKWERVGIREEACRKVIEEKRELYMDSYVGHV